VFFFGLVWFGLVWFGLVWFGLVWFALPWSNEATNQQNKNHFIKSNSTKQAFFFV
jgi:cbb3-type cytochrome oxidase subunit 3